MGSPRMASRLLLPTEKSIREAFAARRRRRAETLRAGDRPIESRPTPDEIQGSQSRWDDLKHVIPDETHPHR
jgi:hypothetical protein